MSDLKEKIKRVFSTLRVAIKRTRYIIEDKIVWDKAARDLQKMARNELKRREMEKKNDSILSKNK